MHHTTKHTAQTMPRRSLLQAAVVGLLAGIVAPVLPGSGPAFAATGAAAKAFDGKKILIVYYSRTGNTRAVAQHIQTQIGGDLVELHTVTPYPNAYRATTEQAKKELQTGYKPPLKTRVDNIAAYDVVFVGSPNWWGTIAAPLKTFLSDYDLSGKTVIPFITHEGSALGQSVADVKSLCPKAAVLDGLAVRGSKATSAQDEVVAWLRSPGMNKVQP